MASIKNLLTGAMLVLLVTLCACGTTDPSEIETMQVDSVILSMIDAQEKDPAADSVAAGEAHISAPIPEAVTEQEAEAGQYPDPVGEAVDAASSEEHATTIQSYYDTNTAKNTAISGKLQTAFSSLGSYDPNAFDAMLTFLGTSEGSWMWEKCLDWSWSCDYDASTARYTLECVGPQEPDGTRGAQYLVAQGDKIVSYPSGYIAAPEASGAEADAAANAPSSDTAEEEASAP